MMFFILFVWSVIGWGLASVFANILYPTLNNDKEAVQINWLQRGIVLFLAGPVWWIVEALKWSLVKPFIYLFKKAGEL